MATAGTIGLFARLLLSLGIVIGLMWAAATMLRRRGIAPGPGRRGGRSVQIELLARKPLGRNTAIAVVRVGEHAMVVGITDHAVTKLDDTEVNEIDLEDAGANWTAPQGPGGSAPAWKAMLDQLRERTLRR